MNRMFCISLFAAIFTMACGADFEPAVDNADELDVQATLTCRAAQPPSDIVRGCLNDAGCPSGGACFSYACVEGTCEPVLAPESSACNACGQDRVCDAIGACVLP